MNSYWSWIKAPTQRAARQAYCVLITSSSKEQMDGGPPQDEHPGSAEKDNQVWNWKPSSGEGSAAALRTLKRAERVKSSWRGLRLGTGKKKGDDTPPSAE